MDRTQKEDLVAALHRTFDETSMIVVTHYSGLTVAQMVDLREQMRKAGASFKVTKNRLTRLALEDTQYESLGDLFMGPTAIAYSDDAVAAAKVAVKFSKENENLGVIGGALGSEILEIDVIKSLATLPSLDELRGKIVVIINTTATRIVGVLQASAGQITRVISTHSTQS